MRNLIIGILIGFIIGGATIAYAYEFNVLVNEQGTPWGGSSNPVYVQ